MEIYDMNLLYDAFRASMNGSAWKALPQQFEMNLLRELTRLSRELEDGTYKPNQKTEFVLCERGKTRYIHGSTMRDRVVQHALCDGFITDALHPYLIHNNGASQKGKGITFARAMFERDLHNYYLQHRSNDGYIVFADLSKFYDNIQHDKVRQYTYPKIDNSVHWLFDELLRGFEVDVSYMTDEEYARCMETIFDSVKYYGEHPPEERTGEKLMRKSVDIGDQVSQNIGIFFPSHIDNYVKIVRGVKRYGRYMDDMYAICETREGAMALIDGIEASAREIGLFVNRKKTHIAKLSDTYTFLKIRYSLTETGKTIRRIHPETVTRERRRLKAHKRLMDAGRMRYEDIKQSYKSWMGNYVKYMSKDQIKTIKSLYYDLYKEDVRWKPLR